MKDLCLIWLKSNVSLWLWPRRSLGLLNKIMMDLNTYLLLVHPLKPPHTVWQQSDSFTLCPTVRCVWWNLGWSITDCLMNVKASLYFLQVHRISFGPCDINVVICWCPQGLHGPQCGRLYAPQNLLPCRLSECICQLLMLQLQTNNLHTSPNVSLCTGGLPSSRRTLQNGCLFWREVVQGHASSPTVI